MNTIEMSEMYSELKKFFDELPNPINDDVIDALRYSKIIINMPRNLGRYHVKQELKKMEPKMIYEEALNIIKMNWPEGRYMLIQALDVVIAQADKAVAIEKDFGEAKIVESVEINIAHYTELLDKAWKYEQLCK